MTNRIIIHRITFSPLRFHREFNPSSRGEHKPRCKITLIRSISPPCLIFKISSPSSNSKPGRPTVLQRYLRPHLLLDPGSILLAAGDLVDSTFRAEAAHTVLVEDRTVLDLERKGLAMRRNSLHLRAGQGKHYCSTAAEDHTARPCPCARAVEIGGRTVAAGLWEGPV